MKNELIGVLDKNKASLSIPLKEREVDTYSEYHAVIQFAENKIAVQIYNDEGWTYDLGESDGMPFEWAEQITTFVSELKAVKAIPDYTLQMTPLT